MHEFLVAVAAFIVLIAVMVVVHEFGHFAVAKLCRVRVEAFSIGFGPRLFGYKYGDTDYKVSLLPFGGYVKMAGENFSELSDAATGTATQAPIDDPGALTSHPRWQQMLIGAAGPAANFVLAFVLMVIYFNFINEVPSVRPIVVEWVTEGSLAAQAGIAPGDIIRRFGSVENPSWEEIHRTVARNAGQTLPVTVERAGKSLPLDLRLASESKGQHADPAEATGLFLQLVQSPIEVDSVTSDSPAARAGLRGGDEIMAVDGHAFHMLDPLVPYLQAGHGKPVILTVSRGGHTIAPIVVTPSNQNAESTWRLGFTYMPPSDIPSHHEPMPLTEAVSESKGYCLESSTLILDVLGRILTRKVSASQISGPVGIARVAGQAAETKYWGPKFELGAAISLNLGIINLLPFPILDGGMILFLLIEGTIRREINIAIKERIYQAAFVMLMAFFVFVIFNDVTKLPIFSHIKP
ncbi:MAG: RIP metalloprotease RseP [Terracidiphilus sp.]|jgi:regulator of sigma E protease